MFPTAVRFFSRKCSPDLKRINPKVPPLEAKEISNGLLQVVKDHGPLTVSNTWNHAKEASITGLNSKTHMKIMLKWMRGRKMLKLFCTHIGSSKKFLLSTMPEEPQNKQPVIGLNLVTAKASVKKKKQKK